MSDYQDQDHIYVHIDEDLEDLIPGYLSNRTKDIKTINKALSEENFETIRIIGHSMKGNGSGYGFDYISITGYNIEEAAKNKDKTKIELQLDLLQSYLNKVVIKYEKQ